MKIKYLIVILTILLFVLACGKTEVIQPEPEPEPEPEPVSAESCFDSILNQGEEGVDCGGPCKACVSCTDGIQNQREEGVDCGGPCEACATCSDSVRNQDEEGIDCGGACKPCPVEKYEIYSEEYLALNNKMKPNMKAVFLKSTVPAGLEIGESYVFAMGITNTMETEEVFLIDVNFKDAEDLVTNPIEVDEETVLSWFEKNDWGEYSLDKYENEPIPVGVTVGENIAPGVLTKPGYYYFEVEVTYQAKYSKKEYVKVDFNFKVK